METKRWCIRDAEIYDKPGGRGLKTYILNHQVLDLTGNQEVAKDQLWSEIKYLDGHAVEKIGWMQDVYLEEISGDPASKGSEVEIPHPSSDPNDAAQYFMWENIKRVNMCGELCVAFIGGDDIETFLTKWKQLDGAHYHLFVPPDSKDKPTGPDSVDNMLKVYGYSGSSIQFKDGLTESHTGFKLSPGRFQKMLATHYLIVAVRIDGRAGNIGEGKIGHWVIVDKVFPVGISKGWVEVYNPFPNQRQTYSFTEFCKSCEAEGWTGLWVNRTPPSPGN